MTENIEFLHTNLKEQMKQNKILKAAAERQKAQNKKLKDFFSENKLNWDNKKTD